MPSGIPASVVRLVDPSGIISNVWFRFFQALPVLVGSVTATLDFPSTAAQTSSDLTVTVAGAKDGDVVTLAVPNGSVLANSCYTAWVSAANTVTVRFNNYSVGAQDPASGSFRVVVTRY
jgi:hypothetical protein